MNNNGKNWSIINTVLVAIGGIAGVASIFTSIKASDYDREQNFKALEERYGLKEVLKP